jgi:hypothetical protein
MWDEVLIFYLRSLNQARAKFDSFDSAQIQKKEDIWEYLRKYGKIRQFSSLPNRANAFIQIGRFRCLYY